MSENKTIELKEGHDNYFFISWDKDGNPEQDIDVSGVNNQVYLIYLLSQAMTQFSEKSFAATQMVKNTINREDIEERDSMEVAEALKHLFH